MNTLNTRNSSNQGKILTQGKLLMGIGILLIALEGLIHLLDAPGSFDDATYKGLLFVAVVIGAMVAAMGIYQGQRWGWSLGVLTAGSALVGYVISRTIGLPGLPVDEWLEPLGVLSLLVEGLFVGLYLVVFVSRRTPLENKAYRAKKNPRKVGTQR
jgi:hypothetical protein